MLFEMLEDSSSSEGMNESVALDNIAGLDDHAERDLSNSDGVDEKFSNTQGSDVNDLSSRMLNDARPTQKDIENSYKKQYKRVEAMDKDAQVQEKIESYNDVDKITEMDGSHFNDECDQDIENAFDFVDIMYDDKNCDEWQETAVRYEEMLNNKLESITKDYDVAEQKVNEAGSNIRDVVNQYDLTRENCLDNKEYVAANEAYIKANSTLDSIKNDKVSCQGRLDSVKPFIKEESRTTYKGFDGSDFKSSYDSFITNRQGIAVQDAKGTCSENDFAGRCNQQMGIKFSEHKMFNLFKENNQCTYEKITPDMSEKVRNEKIKENGGTDLTDRVYMANQLGLEYKVDKGKDLSLVKMQGMMEKGYSVGMVVKGEDLSQKNLSQRTKNFGIFGVKKSDVDNNYGNHMVTVAGFSFDKNNNIKGVWVNDTGGFTSSNRVFISSEKFNEMKSKTIDMSAEYCKIKTDDTKTEVSRNVENKNAVVGKVNDVSSKSKNDLTGEKCERQDEKLGGVNCLDDFDFEDFQTKEDNTDGDNNENKRSLEDYDAKESSYEDRQDDVSDLEKSDDDSKESLEVDSNDVTEENAKEASDVDSKEDVKSGSNDNIEKTKISGREYIKEKINEIINSKRTGEIKLPKNGEWRGNPGNSLFIPSDDNVKDLLAEHGVEGIEYKDNRADFGPVKYDQNSEVSIEKLSIFRYKNFQKADERYAEVCGISKQEARDIRVKNKLTWHEIDASGKMVLVSTDIHKSFAHSGGISELKRNIKYEASQSLKSIDDIADDLDDSKKTTLDLRNTVNIGDFDLDQFERGIHGK